MELKLADLIGDSLINGLSYGISAVISVSWPLLLGAGVIFLVKVAIKK